MDQTNLTDVREIMRLNCTHWVGLCLRSRVLCNVKLCSAWTVVRRPLGAPQGQLQLPAKMKEEQNRTANANPKAKGNAGAKAKNKGQKPTTVLDRAQDLANKALQRSTAARTLATQCGCMSYGEKLKSELSSFADSFQ